MKSDKMPGLSPYGKFVVDVSGYTFLRNGKVMDKWNLFELGYKAEKLLEGQYENIVKKDSSQVPG